MLPGPGLQLTRKQLYDEIWEISAVGVAKKYHLSYPHLLKRIKEERIEIPPAGYWTKKSFNKETTTIPLSGDPERLVSLGDAELGYSEVVPQIQAVSPPQVPDETPASAPSSVIADSEIRSEPKVQQPPTMVQGVRFYDRDRLYQEVWAYRREELAQTYDMEEAALTKLCQALAIPMPPANYWKKLHDGKPVTVPPLPQVCARAVDDIYTRNNLEKTGFLSDGEQAILLSAALYLSLRDEREKQNPNISRCRKQLRPLQKGETGYGVENVSGESIPRTLRILDALTKTASALGMEISDRLYFSVGADRVQLQFSELKDKTTHQLTRQEKLQLVKYEEEKKKHSWASRPQIPKYDYTYNGRLSVSIGGKYHYHDTAKTPLEERLGDMLLSLTAAIHDTRLVREEQEERARKAEEERQRKEELRRRYDREAERTAALVNMAEDYHTACKIRAMVNAMKQKEPLSEEETAFISWAEGKADWFDPTIAAKDPCLGTRDHGADAKDKELKREWWRW